MAESAHERTGLLDHVIMGRIVEVALSVADHALAKERGAILRPAGSPAAQMLEGRAGDAAPHRLGAVLDAEEAEEPRERPLGLHDETLVRDFEVGCGTTAYPESVTIRYEPGF